MGRIVEANAVVVLQQKSEQLLINSRYGQCTRCCGVWFHGDVLNVDGVELRQETSGVTT